MRAWAVLVAGLSLACANLGGLSGGSVGRDAAPVGDGSSGSDAGAPNLLVDPSFDDGPGSGCAGWTGDTADATRSTTARTGSYSCMLCPVAASDSYFDLESSPVQVVAGDTYYAEAWFLAPPSGPVAPLTGVVAYESVDGGAHPFQGSQVDPSSIWALSSLTFTALATGSLTVDLHGFYPHGGCTLVDDAALYKE